jgi:hypothetical protein
VFESVTDWLQLEGSTRGNSIIVDMGAGIYH